MPGSTPVRGRNACWQALAFDNASGIVGQILGSRVGGMAKAGV